MSLRQFLKDHRAGVAPMFALALIPIFGLVGAAVDYSRANAVRTAMQVAADSTALMLSKDALSLTPAQLSAKGNAYFQAMFSRPEAKNLSVTSTYTAGGGSQLTIAANASVDSSFMKVMGYPQLAVSTSSVVKWGNQRLRVALVLDNTGSMNDDGKMAALISATKNLITQLKNAASVNGDVYVSIVPFVKDVNVGPSNYNANWIDWTEWDKANGTCKNFKNYGRGSPGDKTTCQNYSGTWTAANHNTWNGCVMDRGNTNAPHANNYDANATTPTTATTATLYAAEQYSYCPDASVMALTYDWSSLTSAVNGMTASGSTNQTIGLQLGWMSLVGGGPFPAPPAMDSNYTYNQVIVLLSDGLNTQNRWYGNGSTVSTQVDARMSLACANVKAAGMKVYTVQVNTGGDPTSTVLQNCASDTTKFFVVTQSSQISSIFNQIGTALTQLRIYK